MSRRGACGLHPVPRIRTIPGSASRPKPFISTSATTSCQPISCSTMRMANSARTLTPSSRATVCDRGDWLRSHPIRTPSSNAGFNRFNRVPGSLHRTGQQASGLPRVPILGVLSRVRRTKAWRTSRFCPCRHRRRRARARARRLPSDFGGLAQAFSPNDVRREVVPKFLTSAHSVCRMTVMPSPKVAVSGSRFVSGHHAKMLIADLRPPRAESRSEVHKW